MLKYTTAIEISAQWIKLAAVRPSIKGFEIASLNVEPVASLDTSGLSGELNALLKRIKFTPYPLIVSFPRNLVTMRNLHLPSNDPKEIEGMIELHIGRQVPYPKEEVISAHQVLGLDDAGYSKVIMAITHREALRQVFNVLNTVNLFPERVELSSQGVLSWLLGPGKAHLEAGKIYISLDIDANFTDFMIVDKDSLLFSRSIASGAEQISLDEARRVKFISELKQSLAIFQSEEMNKKPAKIFISGATDNVTGLIAPLEAEINAPVEIIKSEGGVPRNVSVTAVLGLALDSHHKKISFILPEAQIRRALKDRSKELILLGSLLMLILVLGCGIFLEKMSIRSSYLGNLDKRFQGVGDDVEKLDSMIKKIEIVGDRLNSRALSLNCLYQIHKLMPSEIVLKMVTFEADDKVTLRGATQEMSDVFKFITTLEKSGYFKDIQTKYTTKKKIADKDMSEFELACPIAIAKK